MVVFFGLLLPIFHELFVLNIILFPIITLFIFALIMSIYRAFK